LKFPLQAVDMICGFLKNLSFIFSDFDLNKHRLGEQNYKNDLVYQISKDNKKQKPNLC